MARPLPPVDSLRCFVAAAVQLNFRRAAAEVALTPAALSQRIKQLEEMLEARLFDRSSQGVALTPAGQSLLVQARTALEALGACADAVADASTPVRFTLGTRFELGMSWIVPAVLELRTKRPQWHVDLVFGSGPEILRRLEQGRVDAIVTSAPIANASWRAEVLHPEGYCFVGAPSLLDEVPLHGPEDAGRHTLLDLDRELPLTRYLLSVCPGLTFRDVWACGTGAAVRSLARAGAGVGVLPHYMVADDIDAGDLTPLMNEFEPLSDTFRLVYREASPVAGHLGDLADELRARPLS